mmetsp:Transcript_2995/g.8360  ORF Transcript_2995/g.8360 Transcript_2995/m.8360 type:complete len:122 (-) Transcript_2995:299-664(-)
MGRKICASPMQQCLAAQLMLLSSRSTSRYWPTACTRVYALGAPYDRGLLAMYMGQMKRACDMFEISIARPETWRGNSQSLDSTFRQAAGIQNSAVGVWACEMRRVHACLDTRAASTFATFG